eukprot:XP_001702229.1 predicted protein [Chlamydomonas reinhardtii]
MASTASPYQLGNPLSKVQADAADGQRQHAAWSPYDDNGGTVVAVAGEDYCIVAASTRMSTGFSILTREATMMLQLGPQSRQVGRGREGLMHVRRLAGVVCGRRLKKGWDQDKEAELWGAGRLLSNTLYYKRFFPFYTFNLCAGLDEQGRGAVYNYDAIGSYERSGYFCQGFGRSRRFLGYCDLRLEARANTPPPSHTPTSSTALDLVKDAFVSAGERDIYTGDQVEILIITREGVRRDSLQLKLD